MKCMQTYFGGFNLSSIGDFAPFLIWPNFHFRLWTMGSKIRIGSKKFFQVEVDVKCMQTYSCGHGLSGFGDFAPFHFPSNFLDNRSPRR